MKNFVTIFPICENVHLTKDLGQIPFFLHKNYNYNSKIVCYKNSPDYSNLEGEVKGLKLEFIKNKGRISFLERGVVKYIRKNAKNIDVLNLYIFSKHTFAYGLLYKHYNPNGFLFLKLDGYNETFAEGNVVKHSVSPLKNRFFKYLEEKFISKVDLITIENAEGERLVKKMFPSIETKIMYLPVGVNDLYLQQTFNGHLKKFEEKENIILTVGRIGEEIKNNEMMLRALALTNLKDWKMIFVGPINADFYKFYKEFVLQNPSLQGKIEFVGEIKDRATLYDYYNRAKVFCMTSHKESFCHSIGEALYFGNYIIGTDGIMSMNDITNKQEFGVILRNNDHKALASVFQRIIDKPEELARLYPGILNHSRKNFTWSQIISKVHQQIESN